MPFRFDHVFVFVPPGGAIADSLVDAGFTEGPRNVHPGQGTQNRRFFFPNGMLELLWCHDPAEAQHPRTARTKLYERSVGQANPLGVALCPVDDEPHTAPFAHWDYTPIYLPAGMAIPMAEASDDPALPLYFAMPMPARTPTYADTPAHPCGAEQISRVGIEGPGLADLPDDSGLLTHTPADVPKLIVEFDGASGRGELDFAPHVPLVVRW